MAAIAVPDNPGSWGLAGSLLALAIVAGVLFVPSVSQALQAQVAGGASAIACGAAYVAITGRAWRRGSPLATR